MRYWWCIIAKISTYVSDWKKKKRIELLACSSTSARRGVLVARRQAPLIPTPTMSLPALNMRKPPLPPLNLRRECQKKRPETNKGPSPPMRMSRTQCHAPHPRPRPSPSLSLGNRLENEEGPHLDLRWGQGPCPELTWDEEGPRLPKLT